MENIGSTLTLSEARRKLKKEQQQLLKKRFFSNYSMVIGLIIVIFLMLLSFVGPYLTSYGPLRFGSEQPTSSARCRTFTRN